MLLMKLVDLPFLKLPASLKARAVQKSQRLGLLLNHQQLRF